MVNNSIIWNGSIRVFGWLSKSLCWKVGDGRSVQVGINHVVGLEQHFSLSQFLFDYLHFNIHMLYQDRIGCDFSSFRSYWFLAKDLDLTGDLYLEWERYVSLLYLVGLHLSEAEDRLVWSYNSASRQITAKLAY